MKRGRSIIDSTCWIKNLREIISLLLDHGAYAVPSTLSFNCDPLAAAIFTNDLPLVKEMVTKGRLDITRHWSGERDYPTPLLAATYSGAMYSSKDYRARMPIVRFPLD